MVEYESHISIIHKTEGHTMSTLIPSRTSCKFDTPGERRFARLLEAKLEDDYLCWYNVPIGPLLAPSRCWLSSDL
ncbi:MAG: hypothetical protein PHP95_14350 [Desulfuromonadaceae bacterium]|nr:hypothetical protein [Desulfuromonadaceae bacterium]MDD2849630.1 hypothetical protein [Desulfuromonadaceae bacterium]MDD4130911.1 hypothetical protein [Desulfuromonadaceae bacterium]